MGTIMEGEIHNFINVWLTVIVSLSYCYCVGKMSTPKGFTRFLCLLPVICLFFVLPLDLHSIHLGGLTAFFIAWLANFKLLLFSYGKGPLSSSRLSNSLLLFVAVACLPIKIQQTRHGKRHLNSHNSKYPYQPTHFINGNNKENPLEISNSNGNHQNSKLDPGKKSVTFTGYVIKCILFAVLLYAYEFSEYIPSNIILIMYCLHIYIVLETALIVLATLARTLLGLELEPQFNEPYLSTSLQDFWGRRWNLMVTSILRPTIYEPTLILATLIFGRKWAPLPSIFATFIVSAIMHELMFYYVGRVRPTWEITWFFLVQGVSLVVEVFIKKVINGNWRLHCLVSTPLTVGFVMVTAFWLFFPQLLRSRGDVRAFEEYVAVGAFFKNLWEIWGFGALVQG